MSSGGGGGAVKGHFKGHPLNPKIVLPVSMHSDGGIRGTV